MLVTATQRRRECDTSEYWIVLVEAEIRDDTPPRRVFARDRCTGFSSPLIQRAHHDPRRGQRQHRRRAPQRGLGAQEAALGRLRGSLLTHHAVDQPAPPVAVGCG